MRIDSFQGAGVMGSSVLTVTNVTRADEGEYVCLIKDHANNTNQVKRFITVLGR